MRGSVVRAAGFGISGLRLGFGVGNGLALPVRRPLLQVRSPGLYRPRSGPARKVRELLATDKALAQRIDPLTATGKDPALFDIVIKDIEKLDKKFSKEIRRLQKPRRRKSRIGFHISEDKSNRSTG